jgi:predicted lactoylglutathione lyase
MTKEFWFNLPSKNVTKAREFFVKMGFTLNTHYGNNASSASFFIGQKNIVMMLFDEATFKSFTGDALADATSVHEVLFSIDAESKEEVDEMAQKAVAAGGKCSHKPTTMQGWMYGCVFTDLDGHRWNVLHMDMSKMPR